MPPKIILFYLIALLPTNPVAGPLYDVHLHYSADDAAQFSPQQIIEKLDQNGVRYAVVTSTPATHTENLYRYAPKRIVPLLGVYRSHADKANWTNDRTLPARIKSELKKGIWRGIGELHIFANDRHKPVFHQIIQIASKHKLPLQIHGDPAVIDTIYDISPSQHVIWAHSGTFPYPDLIADYLKRYPALTVDLSVRNELIAPNGQISDEWYELFVAQPNRFMIGVDTYSLLHWHKFDSSVATIRNWLAQLPDDVAQQIAYDNALALFGKPGEIKLKQKSR